MAKRACVLDRPKEPAVRAEARRRRQVLELILRERRHLLQGGVVSRSLNPDPIEVAQDLEEEQVWLAVLEQSREIQAQVDEAMHLLAEGRYGQCVSCGEPIPVARLRALPFALRCLQCQERFETRKRNRAALESPTGWVRLDWE